MNKIKFWFLEVSRGYSVPMSILNSLIIFFWTIKIGNINNFSMPNVNIFYGILAIFGVVLAHLGGNIFDDLIDYKLKMPKQGVKTAYLDQKKATFKQVCTLCAIYFLIAGSIGAFLIFKTGFFAFLIAFFAFIISLLYPRLSSYYLGEIGIFISFAPLLFLGINFVMTSTINFDALLLSLPVGLMTIIVLIVHSLMDYDFDLKSGKKTLILMCKSKQNALNFVIFTIICGYFATFLAIYLKILPKTALLTLLISPLIFYIYKNSKAYIEGKTTDFMHVFMAVQTFTISYNLILIAVILF